MSEFDITPTSHILMDDSTLNNAKVKVFGVGGAGGNTVNRMVDMNIEGVEYYAVNTDAMALDLSKADHKIAIGQKTTKNLGAGAKPEVGRKAAEENVDDLKEAMKGADLVFITAGMGGGTGTGAAPVVGAVARELGILTIAVVTKPFRYEGPVRKRNAESGIQALRKNVDTMIVVDNKKLAATVESTDKKMTLKSAFRFTDEILGNAVRSICDIMFRHGLIHVDFADVKTVMSNGGAALMGTGIAEGEGRGVKAVDMALSSPLLEEVNVEGASGVLVNVSHGENYSMLEHEEALDHLYEAVGEMGDPNIIVGDILLPELGDKVSITVIATGCGGTSGSEMKPMFANAADVPMAPAAPKIQDLVNSIGGPASFQPAQPVAATPRPTATNFVALSQPATVPVTESLTIPMGAVPQEAQTPATDFASAQFNAQAPAFEEKLMPQGVATATLPETEEMPGIADMDQLSNGDYGTPAYTRQTMAEMPAREVEEPRNTNYAEGSLKTNGVDYDVPAFLRNGGFKLDSF
ncbi:MAG: cell division protein FtsZ [Fibrobacter sp.]|nr:cell division protein FtsZ [Fibrobacter sp.]